MRHGFFLMQLDAPARFPPCRRRGAVFPDVLSPPPFCCELDEFFLL
jgi:hypothetical protein